MKQRIFGTVLPAIALLAVCQMAVCPIARGDDWNQWLGESRDGTWNAKGIVKAFPDGGPPVLWRTEIEGGYAGPAVQGDRVVVMDYLVTEGDPVFGASLRPELDGKERVLCLDAETGEQIWKYEYDCSYRISYPAGPRATPAIDGERVYTLGAEGYLHCLDMADGSVIWSKDFKQAYGIAETPTWGFASHPLVDGDTLYCVAGGEGSVAVAFDKETGEEKWRALTASEPGYCPPTLIHAGGVEQLLIWHAESLNSLNPETGEVYWSHELKSPYGMSIAAPVHYQDYLFACAMRDTSLLLQLAQNEPAAKELWRGKAMHPEHNPPLIVDGYLYGIDSRGWLRCFDLKTGEKQWETLAATASGRPAPAATGFIVKNRDQYFIANEGGELILANLSPDGFKEIGRMQMLEPTTPTGGRRVVWSHPAFANKCVYARNDEEIVCISLAADE